MQTLRRRRLGRKPADEPPRRLPACGLSSRAALADSGHARLCRRALGCAAFRVSDIGNIGHRPRRIGRKLLFSIVSAAHACHLRNTSGQLSFPVIPHQYTGRNPQKRIEAHPVATVHVLSTNNYRFDISATPDNRRRAKRRKPRLGTTRLSVLGASVLCSPRRRRTAAKAQCRCRKTNDPRRAISRGFVRNSYGSPGRIRTYNLSVNSRVLCR